MQLLEIFKQLLMAFLQLFFALLNPVFLIPAIIIVIVFIIKNKEYKKCTYYQITKLPYFSVRRDIGKYGEYLTYKYLKKFETNGAKFLFNVYIPKENGETTEIDVLMICSKGVFVFESKNYSGWIFGSETQKNWYQTLPKGRGRSHKECFYNPIMQNRSHIKCLKAFINEEIPMRSIIVFSDRCTLKSVQVKSADISVINRYNVYPVVSRICEQIPDVLLTQTDIALIYDKLYPYTQVDKSIKEQHITNIHNNLAPQEKQKYDIIAVDNSEIVMENVSVQSCETANEETQLKNTDEQIQKSDAIITKPQENDGIQIQKCPKCNGNLILRTATKGANSGKQFYGCSNFPKCKYIQKL